MQKNNGKSAKTKGTARIGSRVRFRMVNDDVEGVIFEDRGFIGAGGRRLWGIEFTLSDPNRPVLIELPEVMFQVID